MTDGFPVQLLLKLNGKRAKLNAVRLSFALLGKLVRVMLTVKE